MHNYFKFVETSQWKFIKKLNQHIVLRFRQYYIINSYYFLKMHQLQ